MKSSQPSPAVAAQVAAANAQVKRKLLRVWLVLGLSILLSVGFMVFFLLFPRLFHSHRFVTMDWVVVAGRPVVVTLWLETSSDDEDGETLRGYELRSHDAETGKELGKLFLDRSLDVLPAAPSLYLGPRGDVWVVQPQDNYQSAPGYLNHLRVGQDGRFLLADGKAFKDLVPLGGCLNGHVAVLNAFQEPGCFSLDDETYREGTCDWWASQPTKGAFFLVTKTNGSIRSKLWHLGCASPAPAPQISVGMVSGDRPLDGVHPLNDLPANSFKVSEERLDYYQSVTDSNACQFRCITQGDYWVDAVLKCQDATSAVVQIPTGEEGTYEYRLYVTPGDLAWTAKLSVPGNPYAQWSCRSLGDTDVFMANQSFVMGIDHASGKVLWQCTPD